MALKYRRFTGKITTLNKNGRPYLRAAYRCPTSGKAKQIWRALLDDRQYDDLCLEIRKAVERALNPPPDGEWIYLIHAVGTQFYKIGITCNLQRRFTALQHASPFDLQVLTKIPGNTAMEYALHKTLAHNRVRGEWYSFDSPEVPLELIRAFKERHPNGHLKANGSLVG